MCSVDGYSTNGCGQWMDTVLMDVVDGYSTNGYGHSTNGVVSGWIQY